MLSFQDMVAVRKIKAIRDINREYWGRIHDICEGTDLEYTPWKCVKLNITPNSIHHWTYKVLKDHPVFNDIDGLSSVEFAEEVKDNRPVFLS